jgi:hypothetical protein
MSRDTARHPDTATSEADGSPLSPLLVVRPDARSGTIRVQGHLDPVGADLLMGSAEALCRQGHRHIHVRLDPPTADPEELALLTCLVERFAACGVRILVD